VLGGSPEEQERAAFGTPGPTLVMRKNERVAITLVNQTHEPAAVHWHGIELESWPDGVVGWSGSGKNVLPMIPAGDSLTVRFTPPRAGTFMYHSHMNEFQQISSGMYGAIVVLEPEEEFDHEHDRLLVFSDGGPTINVISGPFPPILLNGKLQPEPMELRAGERYRFRVIGIPAESIIKLELLDGTRPVQWTMIAKDGATLPPAQAKTLPAHLEFAAGEIYDFAFIPDRTGSLTLRFGPGEDFPGAPPVVSVAVNVR
jgi:manganese oxidase